MGRSLQNTMINLGIQGACDEAMYQASQIISSTNFSIDFYLRMRKENKESLESFHIIVVIRIVDWFEYRRIRGTRRRCWSR